MSSSESDSARRREEFEEEGQGSSEEEDSGKEQDVEGAQDEECGEEEEGQNGHPTRLGSSSVAASASLRNSAFASYARSCKSMSLSTLAFPISRVRRLVKSEVDVQWVGMEAGFLIAKAAELFLENLVENAFDQMIDDERTSLSYKDIASHVNSADRLDFLADFVPEPISASLALPGKGQANR